MICVGAVFLVGLSSCEKVKNAGSSLKEWWGEGDDGSSGGDATAEVTSVDQEQGESIIAEEERLVMVEYYSDT